MKNFKTEFEVKAKKVESELAKLQEAKANCTEKCECSRQIEGIHYTLRYLQDEINYLAQTLEKHYEGHLPPARSTEQLQRALEILELDKEYDIVKRVILASRRDAVFVV